MENNKLREYLKRLEELDNELSDNSDPNEYIKELNIILKGLSQDTDLDTSKKSLLPTLKFVNKSNNPDPTFVHEGDSGFDLRAYFTNGHEQYLSPGEIIIVPTGLFFEITKGLEIQIRPRSGLATQGITIVNTPGTIDSHYRGEIQIIIANLGRDVFTIKPSDRIAQAVVCPVYGEGNLNLIKVEKLSETERGDDGFGSTGKN